MNQRFIIVAGKGGVGRSTMAAALALCFARKNLSTLLATADPHSKLLSDLFGRHIGAKNTPIAPNLEAVNIQPIESIKEYTLMVLKIRYLQRLLVGGRAMQSFISNIPGICEWAVMGKVTYHLIEKHGGTYRYDKVLLDTPATGHALSLIRVPLFISNVISSGPMRAVAMERAKLLCDPTTTAILLVSIPEELAVSEALETYRTIKSEIGVPVVAALMNRTLPELFSPEEEATIMKAAASNQSSLLSAALLRINRTRLQKRQIDRIRQKLPVVMLPEIGPSGMNRDHLERFADILEKHLIS